MSRSWHSNGSSFLWITRSQSSASKGLLDPAKVGGLVIRKAISLSFMVCSRGCLLTRALARASSMRVRLLIAGSRSLKGGGGGSGASPWFPPPFWLTSCSFGRGSPPLGCPPIPRAAGVLLREALELLREAICRLGRVFVRL